jgi:hypothetical protein
MKSPCRWKAPPAVTSHHLSRGDGHGGLGGFLTRKARCSKEHKASRSAKALRHSAEEEDATEVSEARLQWAPWEEDSHAPIHA